MSNDTTTASVLHIYDEVIKPLSSSQRLKLASLILNGIPEQAMVDYSGEWSAEDLIDFSAASFQLMDQRSGEIANDSTG